MTVNGGLLFTTFRESRKSKFKKQFGFCIYGSWLSASRRARRAITFLNLYASLKTCNVVGPSVAARSPTLNTLNPIYARIIGLESEKLGVMPCNEIATPDLVVHEDHVQFAA